MLSAQCNDSRGDTETMTTVMTTRCAGSVVGPRAVRSVRYRPPAPRPAGPPAIERERASHRYSRRRAGGRAAGPLTSQRAKHKRRCTVMTDVAGGGRRSSTCRRQQPTLFFWCCHWVSPPNARGATTNSASNVMIACTATDDRWFIGSYTLLLQCECELLLFSLLHVAAPSSSATRRRWCEHYLSSQSV